MSCQGSPTLTCQNGATTESCCTTITVPGDTFPMGRSEESTVSDYYSGGNADELPEHSATVATFGLDKYEVTVGRFRKFVNAYDSWHVTSSPANPENNAGVHPIAGNTGWGQSWTVSIGDLPAGSGDLKTSLKCSSTYQTWTDDVASNENYPITCVTWYEAFAFCIWDGGRLPTEAEWEYVAAGGTDNYLYPWGPDAPDSSRANFAGTTSRIAVGSYPAGNGRWGHADLAGSMWEWAFDTYLSSYYGTSGFPATCANCASTGLSSYRAIRGNCWANSVLTTLRSAFRNYFEPAHRDIIVGFRCARSAP
jgi:formylglycine-generating enzyme